MPRVCAVLNCYNNSSRNRIDRNGLPINNFSWPCPQREPDRFAAFCRLCCINEASVANARNIICSIHFLPSDIIARNRHVKAALHPLSVPSLNLPAILDHEPFTNDSNNLSFPANDDLSELLCGDTVSLIGCIVEVSAEDENGESVDDIIPTLIIHVVLICLL